MQSAEDETKPLLADAAKPVREGAKKSIIQSYDEILAYIGDMGVWQFSAIAILWPPSMAGGIIVLLSSFTALEPRAFRCALQMCDGPAAKFGDVNETIFFEADTLRSSQDYCTKPMIMSDYEYNNATDDCSFLDDWLIDGYEMCSSNERIIYDDFEFDSTIATDFNLVCDQQYKVALSGTLYFVGLLTGALIGGFPADFFGRKPVLFFFILIGGFSNLIGGLVSTFPLYVLFRLMAGIGEQGLTQLTCTMSVEMVGAKYQSLVGNVNQIFFALGTGVTGLLAYFIRDWRTLHFATAGLIIPQILLWWVIPESPRWLITKQKWEPLGKVMQKCLKWNNAKLPANLEIPKKNGKPNAAQNYGRTKAVMPWYSMFTNAVLRKRILILMLDWGLVALVYYGIGMSMTQLGGNIFINFILAAVGEVLGYIFNIAVANYWGRKPTVVVGFLIAGVCCVTAGVIPSGLGQGVDNLRLVLLILGKLGCSGAFATCYVYTSELFPTPIRNTAVGFCSMSSRLVSIFAPFLTLYLPDVTFAQLPFIVFGVGTLVGAGISSFLPESLGHPLPDTIEEASRMGTKSFWACWSSSKLQEEVSKQRTVNQAHAATS